MLCHTIDFFFSVKFRRLNTANDDYLINSKYVEYLTSSLIRQFINMGKLLEKAWNKMLRQIQVMLMNDHIFFLSN